jgi:hypothetical protein
MPTSKRISKLGVAITALAITAGSLMVQIAVVNSGSLDSHVADAPKTAVQSFNAGATATNYPAGRCRSGDHGQQPGRRTPPRPASPKSPPP